jgi:hypothetical protein
MHRSEVDRWLAGYIEAWRTYDRERIAALFSVDAKYRYHPYDEWICGRDAIVSSWLGDSNAEGGLDAGSVGHLGGRVPDDRR